MSGLGGSSKPSRLIAKQVDLPSGVDDIVDCVRDILVQGNIHSITIRENEPITYERKVSGLEMAPEVQEDFVELSIADVIRNIQMEEFNPEEQGMPRGYAQYELFWMIMYIEQRGLSVTHLVLADNTKFWQWMGIGDRVGTKLDRLLGLKVLRDKTLPAEVFMLCAAEDRRASIAELRFSLKGAIINA